MVAVRELAKMIDHSLLHPTMTDQIMKQECAIADQYKVASVCIKPYAVEKAVQWLKESEVLVGTVIGFPHGNSVIDIKVKETERAISDGAKEIDMVVNIGKVLQKDWNYIETEVRAINQTAVDGGAILKVIFENDHLPHDELKIKLCEICSDIKVAFVKTSTGYGFVKGEGGNYFYRGATTRDLKLMRKHAAADVQVKAAGGVRSLDDLLKVRNLGVTRVGATATVKMLQAAEERFGNE